METEPPVAFAAIRAVLYIAVALTGAWLSPDDVEPILKLLGSLLGVDAATTLATRSKVTPVGKKSGPQP